MADEADENADANGGHGDRGEDDDEVISPPRATGAASPEHKLESELATLAERLAALQGQMSGGL